MSSICQTNFISGYILTNEGDTLKGLIDQRNWEYNPQKINFKYSDDAIEQTFSYTEIKEFRTTKEWYISAAFETENSMRMDNLLETDSSFKIKHDTGFLQVLQRGNKSLFYFKKKGIEANFYIERDGKIELLLYKRHMADSVALNANLKYKTTVEVQERKNYIKQLETYLPACVKVISLLNYAKYSETYLEKIFNTYNKECGVNQPSYIRRADRLKFYFGITAGSQMTKLSFKPTNIGLSTYGPLVRVNHEPSLNFTGGLFMNITFQRGLRRLSVYNELGFGSYSSKWIERVTAPGTSSYREYDNELAISYFKLSHMLQYRLPLNNRSSIIIRSGIFNSLNSEKKNYQKETLYSSNNPIKLERKVLPEFKKWDPDLLRVWVTSFFVCR